MKPKKKIAVFSYRYLPFCDGTISCLRNVVVELAELYDVYVFCEREDIFSEDIEKVDNYTIIRKSVLNDYAIIIKRLVSEKISKINNKSLNQMLNFFNSIIFAPASIISRFIGTTNIETFSKRIKKIIENNEFDYVMCTDACDSVVRHLSRALNAPYSPEWIFLQFDLYYNNPTISDNERKIRYNEQLEWYDKAKMIVIQPEMMNQSDDVLFSNFLDKIQKLHLPALRSIKKNVICNKDAKEIVLVYAGSFYEDIRNPKAVFSILLKVAEQFNDISIKVFSRGCDDIVSEYSEKFQGNMHCCGFISQDMLEEEYSNADFILSIGNTFDEMIPSKTLEIVQYRKPIIHFSLKKDDRCLEYLKGYPLILQIDLSSSEKYDSKITNLVEFININKGILCDYQSVDDIYSIFTAKYFAKDIFDYMEGIIYKT